MAGYSNLLFLLMDNLAVVVEHILLFLFADMFLYRRWRGVLPRLPALAIGWLLQYYLDALDVGLFKLLLSMSMDAACLLLYYTGNRLFHHYLKKCFFWPATTHSWASPRRRPCRRCTQSLETGMF